MEGQTENQLHSLTVTIDKDIYETEVILKTAYQYTERCYIKLDQRESVIVASFEPKESGDDPLERIVNEFCNELIDQQVRTIVEKESGEIRRLIVRKAFSPIV